MTETADQGAVADRGAVAARWDDAILRGFGRLLANRGVWLALVAATAFGALLRYLTALINHDTAWYLDATARWLAGGVLYRDIIEVNPPLAFFLTVPPVAVARAGDLFPVPIYVVYVFLLIALSLLLAWRLSRAWPDEDGVLLRRGLILAGLLALSFRTAGDFGQREHLMMIFVFPYLILVALRAARLDCAPALAIATGALATLGFGLKPYFLLVPAVLEAYLLLRTHALRRAFRPETLTLGIGLVAYLGVIAVATPDYLTTIVPFAREVYWGYETELWILLLRAKLAMLCLLLLGWFYLSKRKQIASRQLTDVFCLAALSFLAIYFVQSKGWYYHLYPAVAAVFLAAGALLLVAVGSRARTAAPSGPLARRGTGLFLALMASLLLFDAQVIRGSYSNPFMQAAEPVVREHAVGSPIYTMSAHVVLPYPLVTYTGARSVSRFAGLWLIPGLVRKQAEIDGHSGNGAPTALQRSIGQYLRDAVVADLRRDPPTLIIVDVRQRKTYFGDLDFDYIEYFSVDPRFVEIWSDYELLTTFPGHQVFKRRSASPDGVDMSDRQPRRTTLRQKEP